MVTTTVNPKHCGEHSVQVRNPSSEITEARGAMEFRTQGSMVHIQCLMELSQQNLGQHMVITPISIPKAKPTFLKRKVTFHTDYK